MPAPCWNLLIYAIARDEEEVDRAERAINDMRAALSANACNIGVQLHTRSGTTRTWISGGRTRTEPLPPQDAGKPSTLRSFLDVANHNFSKKSSSAPVSNPTALVLWAHSTGLSDEAPRAQKAAAPPGLDQMFASPAGAQDTGVDVHEVAAHAPEHPTAHHPRHYGCCWGPDSRTGDVLTVTELKKAITASIRHRVDLLGLNACGMAFLEVVYELRHIADVQVASQVEAKPWPYGAIVEALVKAPQMDAVDLAHAIVDAVRAEIARGRPDAISAFQCGQPIEDLAAALDKYARRVSELIDDAWPEVSKAVMKDAWRVDDVYMTDLASLLHVLGRHDVKAQASANAVHRHLHAVRLAAAANDGHGKLCGLSIFCPKTTYRDIADLYEGLEFRNRAWRDFVIKFQRKLPARP
ncbi:MAG TPA: clostripain-related cysteine peptidase [Kofleriaceae bacterium]|nr:clostripain-related cysteine peptidase [Kofleriaceae bacterium]